MFQENQVVVALSNVQGMREGEEYEVVGVHVRHFPFGRFVEYQLRLRGSSEPSFYVRNGHLLLAGVPS